MSERRPTGVQPQGIHAPDCSIWEVPPEAGPEALLAEGLEDERAIAYLGAARPVYDAFKRVLGQLAGLLLLASGAPRGGLDLDHAMYRTAAEQLREAGERLRALKAPPPAARHYALLEAIHDSLNAVAAALEGRGGRSEEIGKTVLGRLTLAQGLMVRAAEPRARMAPVDFEQACCSCSAMRDWPDHLERAATR